MDKACADIDVTIARVRRRLAALEQIRALVAENPGLLADLIPEAAPAAVDNRQVPAPRHGPTHFERVRDIFLSRNNSWLATPQLVKLTGLPRGGVSHILYKTRKAEFEQSPARPSGKTKMWRMKPAAYDAAIKQGRYEQPPEGVRGQIFAMVG